eukprot:TRINITY_DN20017_c0_g1_i1.p1 TRINITY_DN20017_c0_g1~~TRINITY_DN20017_c0_g1_i1.p1  ORF type:complete len:2042 (+),score=496.17 TRINITY_DN20017_c0_g1_i1:291-6128(+)
MKSISASEESLFSDIKSELKSLRKSHSRQKSEVDTLQLQLKEVTKSLEQLQMQSCLPKVDSPPSIEPEATQMQSQVKRHINSNLQQIAKSITSKVSVECKGHLSSILSDKLLEHQSQTNESINQIINSNDAFMTSINSKIASLKNSKSGSTEDIIQHCEKLIAENNNLMNVINLKVRHQQQVLSQQELTFTEAIQHCEQVISENNSRLISIVTQRPSEAQVQQICEDQILKNQSQLLSAVESKIRLSSSLNVSPSSPSLNEETPSGEHFRSICEEVVATNNNKILALLDSKITANNTFNDNNLRQACDDIMSDNNQKLITRLEAKFNKERDMSVRQICEDLLEGNNQQILTAVDSKLSKQHTLNNIQQQVRLICNELIAESNDLMITTINSRVKLSQSLSRDQPSGDLEAVTSKCEELIAENNQKLLSTVDSKLRQLPKETNSESDDEVMPTFVQKLEEWVRSSPQCLGDLISSKQSAYSLDVIKSFLPTAIRGSSATITAMVNEWLVSNPYSMNVLIDGWVATHPSSLRNWATENVATTADSLRSHSEIIKEITEMMIDDKVDNLINSQLPTCIKSQSKLVKEICSSCFDEKMSNINTIIDEHLSTSPTISNYIASNTDAVNKITAPLIDQKLAAQFDAVNLGTTIDNHLSTNPSVVKDITLKLIDDEIASQMESKYQNEHKQTTTTLINNKLIELGISDFEGGSNYIRKHTNVIKQITSQTIEEMSPTFESQILNWIGGDPEILSQFVFDKVSSSCKRLLQSVAVEEIERWSSSSFQSLFGSGLRKSADSVGLLIEEWIAAQPLSLSSLVTQMIQKHSSETLPSMLSEHSRSYLHKDVVRMIENWIQTSPESLRSQIRFELSKEATQHDIHQIIDRWVVTSPSSLHKEISTSTTPIVNNALSKLPHQHSQEDVIQIINKWLLTSPDSLTDQFKSHSVSSEEVKKIMNEWISSSPLSLETQIKKFSKQVVEPIKSTSSQSEMILKATEDWVRTQPAALIDFFQTSSQDLLGSEAFHTMVADILENWNSSSRQRPPRDEDIYSSNDFIAAVSGVVSNLIPGAVAENMTSSFESWVGSDTFRKAVDKITNEGFDGVSQKLLSELHSLSSEHHNYKNQAALKEVLEILSTNSSKALKAELRKEFSELAREPLVSGAGSSLSEILLKVISCTSIEAATTATNEVFYQLRDVVGDNTPQKVSDGIPKVLIDSVTAISNRSLSELREELLSQLNDLADSISQSIHEIRNQIPQKEVTSRTDSLLQKLRDRTDDFTQSTQKGWLEENQTYLSSLLAPSINVSVNEKFKIQSDNFQHLRQSVAENRIQIEDVTRELRELQQRQSNPNPRIMLPDMAHRDEQVAVLEKEVKELKTFSNRIQKLESNTQPSQHSDRIVSDAFHRQQVRQLISSEVADVVSRVAVLEQGGGHLNTASTTFSDKIIKTEVSDLTSRMSLLESKIKELDSNKHQLTLNGLSTRLTTLESHPTQSITVSDPIGRTEVRKVLKSELSELSTRMMQIELQQRGDELIGKSEMVKGSVKEFIEENIQFVTSLIAPNILVTVESLLPAAVRTTVSDNDKYIAQVVAPHVTSNIASQLERSGTISSLVEEEFRKQSNRSREELSFDVRDAIRQQASTLSQIVVPDVISFLNSSNLLKSSITSYLTEGKISSFVMDILKQNLSKLTDSIISEVVQHLESSHQLQQIVTSHINAVNRDETNSSLALSNSKDFKGEVPQQVADFVAMKVSATADSLSHRLASLERVTARNVREHTTDGIETSDDILPKNISLMVTKYINQQLREGVKDLVKDVVLDVLKSNASFFAGAILPGVLSDVQNWLELNTNVEGGRKSPAVSLSKVQDIVTSLVDDKLTDGLQNGISEENIKSLLRSKMDSNIVVTELIRLENSKTNRLETNELLSQKANVAELQNLADELNEIKNSIMSHQQGRRLSQSP